MLKLQLEDITVVHEDLDSGEMEVSITPTTQNGEDCLNVVMDLLGLEDAESFLEWAIMSTVDSDLETNRPGTDGDKSLYIADALTRKVNEIIAEQVKLQ